MKEIEDSAIIDGDVVGNDLILTRYDTAQINAGSVRGAQGVKGDTGLAGPPAVVTSTTRPANPTVGMMIYETDTKKLLIYNGTAWNLPSNIPKLNSHFQARRTTALAIPNGVFTEVPMPTVDEFTGSGTWNGTAITIGTAGLYIVGYSIVWVTNGNGSRLGYIWDGTNMLAAQECASPQNNYCSQSGQVTRRFASGTVLTPKCLQTSGGFLNISPDYGRTHFYVTPLF
jgi:hypothetical protein